MKALEGTTRIASDTMSDASQFCAHAAQLRREPGKATCIAVSALSAAESETVVEFTLDRFDPSSLRIRQPSQGHAGLPEQGCAFGGEAVHLSVEWR